MKKERVNNKDKKHSFKHLNEKLLTSDEISQYRSFGVPDPNQNWLELFDQTIVNDLFTIMHSSSDNQRKARQVRDHLEHYGFKAIGLGTNILTMVNALYPGVVFKIALDDFGLADNFNDVILQDMIPHYNRVFCRHASSIVSVQERKVVMTQDRMSSYRSDIIATLAEIAKEYLIVDLDPSMYLNYGVNRDGAWCFIDASDIYPLAAMKEPPRCNRGIGYNHKKGKTIRCDGRWTYNSDFSRCVCTHCGREVLPSEIKPRKEVPDMENFMSDGNSKKRRQEMLDAEMAEIKRKLNPTAVEVEDEDEEDDDDFVLPTKENPRTIFVNARENPIVFEDEDVIDDDDDDIDLVDNTTLDEDDDDDEIIDDPNLESSVAITVNNWTDAGIPSINVTVNGDFDKAWEKDGLPLTVTINKDTSVALSVQDLYKILKPTVDEIIDDMQ